MLSLFQSLYLFAFVLLVLVGLLALGLDSHSSPLQTFELLLLTILVDPCLDPTIFNLIDVETGSFLYTYDLAYHSLVDLARFNIDVTFEYSQH